MGRYSPIWNKLKQTGTCAISVPAPLHKRVIKAVIQEKYRDLAFRFHMSENNRTAKLWYEITGARITFRLSRTLGVEDL
jgi:hypothetical protein